MELNPIPQNEAQRLAALAGYNILDTPKEQAFDRLSELAAIICGAPIAMINLIDEDRQWTKSRVGDFVDESPRDESFCQYTIMDSGPFEVRDAAQDERFKENQFVSGAPNIRFYFGVPLKDPEGYNLGALCVIDREPRVLTKEQSKALKLIAQEVISQIIARKKHLKLQQLERLYDMSMDLICIVGPDGNIKRLNPAFTKHLGWSIDQLLSNPLFELIHPDDREKAAKEMELLYSGAKTIHSDVRVRNMDGDYINFRWTSTGDIDTGDIYSIGRDETDRILRMKELEEAKKQAELASSVKDKFLANMSHEIRTPLNAIIGFNDLLKSTPLNPEQQKHVDIVASASQNLMAIINDVLDTSKLESVMITLEKKKISVRSIIEYVIKLNAHKAREKGVKLIYSIDQDIPEFVIGDQVRLTQILVNLVNNSIKFTKEGTIELNIMELSREDAYSTIQFSVKDTGIGIPKEKQEEIFERFTQAETSTTRVFGGTGLGLNIAKMLVEMHDSKIELNSEHGKGSEFSFTIIFPIAHSDDAFDIEENGYAYDKSNLEGVRILLVEDNEFNQLLASTYLTNNKAIADKADDGIEAIEKIKENEYDLILMDLEMPRMDGFEATRFIRDELTLDIPIVACSAHSLSGEKEACLSRGMNAYISKPYTEEELLRVITSQLERKNSNDSQGETHDHIVEVDDFQDIIHELETKGGYESVIPMVQILQKRIPKSLTNLKAFILSEDYDAIEAEARLLAGTLGSLSFHNGYKLAKDIQMFSKLEDKTQTTSLTNKLIEYLEAAFISLDKILRKQ